MEVDAPGCVEATLFHQPDRHRYVVCLVNFQKDLPNIPVDGVKLRLRLKDRPHHVTILPSGRPLKHRIDDDTLSFPTPRLETLAMFAINTE
jgi:hypothetical protein